jgi:hypothetical protein
MICPQCDGDGTFKVSDDTYYRDGRRRQTVPCPRCQGSGIAYCCEGDNNADAHDPERA